MFPDDEEEIPQREPRTILEYILLSRGWGQRFKGEMLGKTIDDPPVKCVDPLGQDRALLVRYVVKDLAELEKQEVEEHLTICACCRRYLERTAPIVAKGFLREARKLKRIAREKLKRKKKE